MKHQRDTRSEGLRVRPLEPRDLVNVLEMSIEYMQQFGFEFARTRLSAGQRVVEFYRNMYEPPRTPLQEAGEMHRIPYGAG